MADQAGDNNTEGGGVSAIEGGSYDVIRRRLIEQATELRTRTDALNTKRMEVFGSSELKLLSTERVRTENNCVPRDMVSIAGHLLFGFQVFLGLKSETTVTDVLSLYRFSTTDEGFEIAPAGLEAAGGFLLSEDFDKEFRDAFRYSKEAQLAQLRHTDKRLLIMVQVGDVVTDTKVFRFSIDAAGHLRYLDARGEEDAKRPRPHDFSWKQTTRDDQVSGEHPHISIHDEVFVETVGGDLTVKIEDNTRDGWGIYREPVEDPNQTLDDADISYARLGALILLRIKPFREEKYRYLMFNTRTKKVARVDAVGRACLQLPEEHGIVFPGGYALRTGETKRFIEDTSDVYFEAAVRSPNGEDVLYVFQRPTDGFYHLMPYNLVRKEVSNPIACNGYSLFDDGRMIVFREAGEPTRVHVVQIWQTPFTSAEFAATAPTDGSFLAKVGNADLVRGISDAYTLVAFARNDEPSRQSYEELIAACTRFSDAYFWVGNEDAGNLKESVDVLRSTTELIIDEFEKIAAIRARASEALAEAADQQRDLIARVLTADMTDLDAFMHALTDLRKQRGHLISLREMREMDLTTVDALENEVKEQFDEVSADCVAFLLAGDAFKPLIGRIEELLGKIDAVEKAVELQALGADLDGVHEGLTLLSEIVAGLAVDDATARTKILEGISEVFAQVNRVRASYQAKRRDLTGTEARAEFAAQFALFGQSVAGAIAVCDTPERCDEQLSRMLVQLEDLEGRFGEFDEFLTDLTIKREEVTEAFGAKRQTLVDARQRKAQNLFSAAERILNGVGRRASKMGDTDELNAYFASDPMVQKLGEIANQLDVLGDSVKAEEARGRLKTARQDAIRALRDRADLFDAGTQIIKLGHHRFSVNTQALEPTLLPRDGKMTLHLTGTGFYDPIEDEELNAAKDLWDQMLISESPDVYRGEYLAGSILLAAEDGRDGLTIRGLMDAALSEGGLKALIREAASDRYDEGYERGVHDDDAARILEKLLAMRATAGLLRFLPTPRAFACLYWAHLSREERALLHRRARSYGTLRDKLADESAQMSLASELEAPLRAFLESLELEVRPSELRASARYLVNELSAEQVRFSTSSEAIALRDALLSHLDELGARRAFDDDLRGLESFPAQRLQLAHNYLRALLKSAPEHAPAALSIWEATVLIATDRMVDRESVAAVTSVDVTSLLGQHTRIRERTLHVRLDEFLDRIGIFVHERVPRYRRFRELRAALVETQQRRLRLDEYLPRVLSSFVRNRLIDEVYLPLIGANLAKQLGASGAAKRTDLMGLLLLISPPGYGKTTLMEYIASKLGLVFVKVNGPSLGHSVSSLDPEEAPNATARQEVDKINFALEMGNNVMLYLDDIQHTNPELLQKFISLCDAQRRIEGVWRGRTSTYDLRGKRFCVVMAGNPYTEAGTKFQIPDMLANRADTYNLGEVLEGKDDLFALSYLENALTSNPVLAPLSGREPKDVHLLLRMAQGDEVPTTDLSYGYSGAELQEMTGVFRHLLAVQGVLLKVNQQYILSAAQEEAFRTEPRFQLQGSYRNMAKIAEKVVPAMNEQELVRLISDHYTAEAQTLTAGAEANLLKLAELRGTQTPVEAERWKAIKEEFTRVKRMGGGADDPVSRVTGTLSGLDAQLAGIRDTIMLAAKEAQKANKKASMFDAPQRSLDPLIESLEQGLKTLSRPQVSLEVTQQAPPGFGDLLAQQISLIQNTLVPLVNTALGRAGRSEVLEARMAELTDIVRQLAEHTTPDLSPPPRFEVELGAHTPSNFYLGVEGGDVVENGGLFIATFARPPAVGSRVIVNAVFPFRAEADLHGRVSWVRDRTEGQDDTAPPGFGIRLEKVDARRRQLIASFVKNRSPLLFEAG
jgi:ATPase involved in DNA repair/ATPase family associated with various cellular activities (AAA)